MCGDFINIGFMQFFFEVDRCITLSNLGKQVEENLDYLKLIITYKISIENYLRSEYV